MKYIRNQNGFAFIELLILLLLLAVLGFVGYRFWQARSHLPAVKEIKVTDPYVGWKTFSNTRYGINFKYPSNWEAQAFEAHQAGGDFGVEIDPPGPDPKKHLKLTIVVNPTAPPFYEPMASWQHNLGRIKLNNTNYVLLGGKIFTSQSDNTIAWVSVYDCKTDNTCSYEIPRSSGWISFAIKNSWSGTTGHGSGLPVDTNGTEYQTMKKIMESSRF